MFFSRTRSRLVGFFDSPRETFEYCSQRYTFFHICPISSVLTTSLPFVDASNPQTNLHIYLLSFCEKHSHCCSSLLLALFSIQNAELVCLIVQWTPAILTFLAPQSFLWDNFILPTELLLTPLFRSCLSLWAVLFVLNLSAWDSIGNRRLSSGTGTQQKKLFTSWTEILPLQWSLEDCSEHLQKTIEYSLREPVAMQKTAPVQILTVAHDTCIF